MRADIYGSAEDQVRRIANETGIAGAVIVQICMEMILENISYDETKRIIKMHVSKAVLESERKIKQPVVIEN